eukprot:evm.model.scf_733EXC.6 EVM.evm.TU.scf_733EXC.6   scf_733EXC:59100-67872(+)
MGDTDAPPAAPKRKPAGEEHEGPPRKAAKRKASGLSVESSCTHFVALPDEFDEEAHKRDRETYGSLQDPKYAGKPAREFPFVLDPFQATALSCLERRESVLVSAHTSAGKTVVAEYAIAMAFRDNQKVIYTSPIKALSNQKFREMGEAFSSHGEADAVGLMTGDVTINPNANCIVMTTEILRSMLYRGSLLLREVAWVVFDEVHYMQDKERGVVWEETIIVLPKEVKMVFLSATLSNAGEFAGWVAHLHKQPCHVVNTDFRPTPLRHYGFPLGGTGLYNLKGEDGIFRGTNFRNLRDSFENIGKKIGGDGQRSGDGRCGRDRGSRRISKQELMDTKMKNVQEITRIMKLLKDKDFIPAIVFSFSKRETELNAMEIANTNFNTEEESAKIREVCTNALSCLSENDRDLPAVQHLLPILEKGVGVHHAGLLPILKEITEILFQEHLVKVLCATETFAMGVNMPARAVIFSSLRKFDGKEERYIKSGEYIQMSGRAGRRGIDDRGYVILMIDEQLDEETCRSMLLGEPAPLKSSFRLSYYTLLNLMRRVEGTQQSMDDVIKLSFQQYQHDRNVPKMEQELKQLEQQAKDALGSMSTDSVLEYNRVSKAIRKLQKLVRKRTVLVPIRILHVLQPGRLVNVAKWGWGMCVSVVREEGKGFKKDSYMLDTLLCCKKDENRGTAQAESVGHGVNHLPRGLGCDARLLAMVLYLLVVQHDVVLYGNPRLAELACSGLR